MPTSSGTATGKVEEEEGTYRQTPEKRDLNVLLSGEQQTTLTQAFDKTTISPRPI